MRRLAILLCMLLMSSAALVLAQGADSLAYRALPGSSARFYALRLRPGQDLRVELGRFAKQQKLRAGFIASCAGSCTRTSVRYANQPAASVREGHFEIVSLSGTLAADGMHVHAEFADSTGAGFGGHLMDGTLVYTTAEIVIGELGSLTYSREPDSTYGYRELVVKRRTRR